MAAQRRPRLAKIRRTRGFSQESLAAELGADRSTVARWERGQCDPQPYHRSKLCTLLQVTPDELDEVLTPEPLQEQARVSPAPVERSTQRLDPLEGSHIIDHSVIARIGTGARFPSPAIVATPDTALSAADLISALWPELKALQRGNLDTTASVSEDDVNRRAALELLAALGITAALTRDALDDVRGPLDSARGAASYTPDDWQHTVWEYGYSIRAEPPARLARDLATDIAELNRQLRAGVSGLDDVSAKLAAFAAMTQFGLGNLPSAHRWWRTARHAADDTGDLSLRVWVRAREAGQVLFAGRPPEVALRMADSAVRLANDAPSGGVTEALAVRSAILAEQGDVAEARKALEELLHAYSALDDQVTADTTSVWGWPEHRLHHNLANIHTLSRDVSEAIKAQDVALNLYPSAMSSSAATVHLDRAQTMIYAGEVDEGIDHACRTVHALPEDRRTHIVRQMGVRVLGALPNSAQVLPGARELKAIST
jgi:transcriptional regulator with XRE-family HTH domain/tetratricopeptide (TPR) repeat protein